MIEQSPVGSRGSNGLVERAVQSLEQQARVMKDALEMKWNVNVPARHSVVPWGRTLGRLVGPLGGRQRRQDPVRAPQGALSADVGSGTRW